MKSFLICGALAVAAWLGWTTLHDVLSPLDIRTEAARASAVAYGTVRGDADHREVVVQEIWKNPAAADRLALGAVIRVAQLPPNAGPDGLVVFLERGWFGRQLRVGTIVAVYHGRLGAPDMSIEEAKALCSTAPSI